MTSRNFREMLEERQRLIHKKAIYSELVEHLYKFLDTDVGPAKTGIRSEGDVLVVPQDYVEEEREAFLEAIVKVQQTIDQIETSMVTANEQPTKAPAAEEVPAESSKKGKAKKPS